MESQKWQRKSILKDNSLVIVYNLPSLSSASLIRKTILKFGNAGKRTVSIHDLFLGSLGVCITGKYSLEIYT